MVGRARVLLALVAAVALAGCASLRVGSDYDREVSFDARETYDWVGVLCGLAASGGDALAVSESQVQRAHQLGRQHTGLDVCATGTAGLAGLLARRDEGAIDDDQRIAVIFTGHAR